MIIKPRWIVYAVGMLLLLPALWSCDYARMKEQEALRTYKTKISEMPDGTIPISGGLQALREINPEKLRNPLPFTQESVNQGKENYGYYCGMCHGPKADGNGTVGQSFYPLPTHLRSSHIQKQSDGRLFYTITFGLNRHPPLGFMLTEVDRWAIIYYIRSLGKDFKG